MKVSRRKAAHFSFSQGKCIADLRLISATERNVRFSSNLCPVFVLLSAPRTKVWKRPSENNIIQIDMNFLQNSIKQDCDDRLKTLPPKSAKYRSAIFIIWYPLLIGWCLVSAILESLHKRESYIHAIRCPTECRCGRRYLTVDRKSRKRNNMVWSWW